MSAGVKTVLSEMLSYAEDNLCGVLVVANKSRYETVNTIFNQGAKADQSPAAQKSFYALTKNFLLSITDKTSKLRDKCMPIVSAQESELLSDLEENEPEHRDAVNGIIQATVGLGLICSMRTRDPKWMMYSLLILLPKFIPSSFFGAYGIQQPSLLGYFVANNATAREWGGQLYRASPANFSHRMLSIFQKGMNASLHVAEKAAENIERMAIQGTPTQVTPQSGLKTDSPPTIKF